MSSWLNVNLIVALVITVAALTWFAWHFISTARRVGLAVSEGRVPRRYVFLGAVAALGVLYVTRR